MTRDGGWQALSTFSSCDSEGNGGGGGWIFVVKKNCIYAHEKITKTQPR